MTKIYVFDLDGTLISSEKSSFLYYETFIEMLKRINLQIFDSEALDFNYRVKILSQNQYFRELFKELYCEKVSNENFCKERLRIEKIINTLDLNNSKKLYVLTSNPCPSKILEKMGLYNFEIISVFEEIFKNNINDANEYFSNYIRIKTQKLRKIKIQNKEEIVYIADTKYDEMIAKEVGIQYIDITELIQNL